MFEEIKPLQQKEYQLLKELKRICDKNNLDYFLAFGTLLGAVRHDGFIPWDDDVDVCMNYEDYVALDEACKKDLNENYFLQSDKLDPQSHMTYKKLRLDGTTCIHENHAHKDMHHGIGIDIYPVFHAADNRIARKKQIICAILYLLLVVEEPPRNHGKFKKIVSKLLLDVLKGNVRNKVKDYCLQEMTKYEKINTNYRVMFYGNSNCCKRVYPAFFFEGRILKKFEDEEFKIPKNYDQYLTFRYGDYMKLPPSSEQGVKLSHLIKIDTENDYKKYKGIYYCVKKENKNL